MSHDAALAEWLLIDLPIMEYAKARELQQDLVAAKAEGKIENNVVLCLEHPRVFTIGRRGSRENLRVTDDFLGHEGVPVVEVERGGDITYHGPGQLILYPIVHLEKAGLGIGDYITSLEDVMLQAASELGVFAERNSLNRGIWIGESKLGNVGICVRRGIAFHGLSLNVNVPLEPFDWINPCGLQGIAVTSIERELSGETPMELARQAARSAVERIFRVKLIEIGLPELRRRIDRGGNAAP